ncbi:uncharacterized protein [Dysidea avara]|uniref:uncharacterized protein isoform X1 n=1 Tax=Dysidea avara TaxID=196820 RepID=UPI00331E8CA3
MEISGIITTASILMSLCFIVSGNNVELSISSTIYAGETVSGKCIFTGKRKPLFIKVQLPKNSNCSVLRGFVIGKEALQSSNYANNFNITCFKKDIIFNLRCFTNTRAKKHKTIQVSGRNNVELSISNTIYAGETVNGRCIFTGEKKPSFIKVQLQKNSNCSVHGGFLRGKEVLQSSNYTNNFNITCFKRDITFDLGCFTDTQAKKHKIIQVLENNVELSISSTIYAGETVSGRCIFTGEKKPSFIKVQLQKNSNCSVHGGFLRGKEALQSSNYTNNFNITCLKKDITFDLKCFTDTQEKKTETIQVISKPKIVSPPLNATVTRPGLPITLSCEVDGDPNHYWVGWFYKSSIIHQNGDDDHSVSVSPSFRSLQGTTHHLTVHSVKHDGKYQCLVFTIRDGRAVDEVAHQVAVANEENNQLSSLLDIMPRLMT